LTKESIMTSYEVNFSYKLPEWGTVTLEAKDLQEAEELALEYVEESYPDVENIEVDAIREITNVQ